MMRSYLLLIIFVSVLSLTAGVSLKQRDDVFKSLEETNAVKTPSKMKINGTQEENQWTDICQNDKQGLKFDISECTDDCGPLGHQTDEWDCPISCECKSSGFIEGDIKFDEENVGMIRKVYGLPPSIKARGASNALSYLWTNRINGRTKVPYVMRNDMPAIAKIAVFQGAVAISGSTCIDFIERTTEVDFIEVIPGTGCWSWVGRRGGKQELSIGPGCEHSATVQHEFLHALGFWHEQSRPDRDKYILIQFENIIRERVKNFEKRAAVDSLGSSYDLRSIMHYHGNAFSKNGKPTILNRATGAPVIAQRIGLSTEDIFQLNTLYNCTIPGSNGKAAVFSVHEIVWFVVLSLWIFGIIVSVIKTIVCN